MTETVPGRGEKRSAKTKKTYLSDEKTSGGARAETCAAADIAREEYGKRYSAPCTRSFSGKKTDETKKRILPEKEGTGEKALLLSCAVLTVLLAVFLMAVNSPLGLFFPRREGDVSLETVVRDVNMSFSSVMDSAKEGKTFDSVETEGRRPSWREVLSVYTVIKTVRKGQSMADLSAGDAEEIRELYFSMTRISSETAEKEIRIQDPETGKEEILKGTVLIIRIESSSASEAAERLMFSEDEMRVLNRLLSPDMDGLWRETLRSVYENSGMAETAAAEIGNRGGEKYWSWYGYGERVEWCACFVSWCADRCGLLYTGAFPKFSNCALGAKAFSEAGKFRDSSFVPFPGAVIFFDWEQDGTPDHVGIVETVSDGRITTVEGNSSDMCARGSYALTDACIYGYGVYSG